MYFGGVLIWSPVQGPAAGLTAGLGGGGLGRCVFLDGERQATNVVQEGQWYHFVLELRPERQVLTVSKQGSQEVLVRLEGWRPLLKQACFLRFFQNDHRLSPASPDTYAQDRGTTWVDNLSVEPAGLAPRKPRPPAVTNSFKVPIVFNRAMRWVTPDHGLSGGAIAYDSGRRLALTGQRAVSRWLQLRPWPDYRPTRWPDSPGIAPGDGETTTFSLSPEQEKCTFVLRGLQFNVEQHSRFMWQAVPTGVEWQLEITATDAVRPFVWRLWRSEWSNRAAETGLDLLTAYRASGRPNRYAEVDVLLRLRRLNGAAARRELRLDLSSPGRLAVVPRWPVVSALTRAGREGVPIEAIVVDDQGRIVTDPDLTLTACIGALHVPLAVLGEHGVRRGVARGLTAGDHEARLTISPAAGQGVPSATTTFVISVTSQDFVTHYQREKRSYCTASGVAVGPLAGDLFAWVPYADFGTPDQRLILGLTQRKQRIEQENRRFGHTKWRSLPRGDIVAYLDYMAASGVRVLRLVPNVNPCEYYLDAGGRLAPHGMEQLAYILGAARRHGMRVVINLFHYPYISRSTGSNPPVWRYIEAGYPDTMAWRSDRMWHELSAYLRQLLGFTGQDPAVMAYTVMGENDQHLPSRWLNRASDLIKAGAPKQMVVLEHGGNILHIGGGDPAALVGYKPVLDGGIGYRTYNTRRLSSDCFMACVSRFFAMTPPTFLGEVACGIKTEPGFITKYRDAMGLALTLQQPMAIAWSAAMIEDQCKAFTEAARLVDWTSFRRSRPPVAVLVEKPDEDQLRRLVHCEEILSSIPLDYDCLRPSPDRGGYAFVIDARHEKAEEFSADVLPAAVLAQAPLHVSPGNHCSYALSQDRRWLVAYLRNAKHYELGLCDIRSVERYRLADRERNLGITLRGFKGRQSFRVWNATTAELIDQGRFSEGDQLKLGTTAADILLLVSPDG